jgi:hypothetical protein
VDGKAAFEGVLVSIVDKAISNSVPAIPRPIVKKISSRYIAGDTLEEAVETVRDLNREGCLATIDLLGEGTESKADAAAKLKDYKKVVDALDEHGLDSGISVKLTGLGLDIDEDHLSWEATLHRLDYPLAGVSVSWLIGTTLFFLRPSLADARTDHDG